ncbi:hypothetical protein [Streptomyces sp. YIM 98790]|uniref:hypothetical protein n=1 Tax=Streptomyces sp. YIM 98790 TaxID=2689077 RepID=UPI0014083C21|nr:hypothetical protein [Streptomyces sp. YIM 98790]
MNRASGMSGTHGGAAAVLERSVATGGRSAGPGSSTPGRRRRFDPARFVLGLCVLALAAGFAGRAAGWFGIPLFVLAAALPMALLLTAAVALIGHGVRRRADRRRALPPAGRAGSWKEGG